MKALQESLNDLQQHVNDQYVGFRPNKGGIRLVHIADGMFRTITGMTFNPRNMLKIAFVSDKKGNIPNGYELEKVYKYLIDNDLIDEKHVSMDDLGQLRPILQLALATDGGYYEPHKSGMRALSAGSAEFMTDETLYADAGDFIGSCIKEYAPGLAVSLKEKLNSHSDSLSLLFTPLFSDEGTKDYSENNRYDDLKLWKHTADRRFFNELSVAGDCLNKYAKITSKNNFLRWGVLFGSWQLVKYMASLENMYFGIKANPFVLDFSDSPDSSVAKASSMSYTYIYQSVSRFYEKAIADYLLKNSYDKAEMMDTETPVYENKRKNKKQKNQEELDGLWEIAKEDAETLSEEEAMIVFGRNIFGMLALEASSNPLNYIRTLGTRAGIFYPPVNARPNKRFKLSYDVIEMLIRSSVEPGEIITMAMLQNRMWERFNIVIGGRSEDEGILNAAGIYIADKDALTKNSKHFADALETMGFANIMADGILQINVGGIKDDF